MLGCALSSPISDCGPTGAEFLHVRHSGRAHAAQSRGAHASHGTVVATTSNEEESLPFPRRGEMSACWLRSRDG